MLIVVLAVFFTKLSDKSYYLLDSDFVSSRSLDMSIIRQDEKFDSEIYPEKDKKISTSENSVDI